MFTTESIVGHSQRSGSINGGIGFVEVVEELSDPIVALFGLVDSVCYKCMLN